MRFLSPHLCNASTVCVVRPTISQRVGRDQSDGAGAQTHSQHTDIASSPRSRKARRYDLPLIRE